MVPSDFYIGRIKECFARGTWIDFGIRHRHILCQRQRLQFTNLLESPHLKASFVLVFDRFSAFLNNCHHIPLLC